MPELTERFPRCVNLDWLEVAVEEPIDQPHDAEYFRACGWIVNERDYGTRVWGEMFTLEGTDHLSFIEVRRNPKSEIIAQNIAHLRFVNRVCYFPNAAQLMQEFIDKYAYTFHHISRVDICYDFETFDYGDRPRDFLRRYIQDKYAKINQCDVNPHGHEQWSGKTWNSISWGSPASDIGTKLYNKTLELYDPVTKTYGKPYIRQAWFLCGLIDDATHVTKTKPDGTTYTPEIWRIEFSIRSSVRNWFCINLNGKAKAKQSIRNTLDMYDSREKLIILFAALTDHYFHFKHLIKRYAFYKDGHTDGNPVRKDRCPDKLLFRWKEQQYTYKVAKESVSGSDKPDREYLRLIGMLRSFRDRSTDTMIKQSCTVILDYLEHKVAVIDQSNPLNRTEAKALQRALAQHIKNPTIDPALLIKLAREELKIRDEINPLF